MTREQRERRQPTAGDRRHSHGNRMKDYFAKSGCLVAALGVAILVAGETPRD
ncbi:hypothetical protein B0G57_10291 [Trinickia symbiotica]|nr:hypothetical protein B0G57_10291 [Trinickia symbiotica]